MFHIVLLCHVRCDLISAIKLYCIPIRNLLRLFSFYSQPLSNLGVFQLACFLKCVFLGAVFMRFWNRFFLLANYLSVSLFSMSLTNEPLEVSINRSASCINYGGEGVVGSRNMCDYYKSSTCNLLWYASVFVLWFVVYKGCWFRWTWNNTLPSRYL